MAQTYPKYRIDKTKFIELWRKHHGNTVFSTSTPEDVIAIIKLVEEAKVKRDNPWPMLQDDK